jgi:hydrogenase maturation protease
MPEKKVVVLGLGNPLMSDEGVGVRVIEQFQKQSDKYPEVEFVDAGTVGLSILHIIQGRQKAVFIDCAYMGQEPGTIRRFKPDDVRSVKQLAHQSLHEMDLLKLIDMAHRLGQIPQEIIIFGIEPGSTEPGLKLSDTVAAKIPDYVAAVAEEFKR